MRREISVLVPTPAYSRLTGPLTYETEEEVQVGCLVRVPLGQRDTLGLVWPQAPEQLETSSHTLKTIHSVLHGIPPLSANWLKLIDFAANYYQRSAGEFAMACLPPSLRDMTALQFERKLSRLKPLAAVSAEKASQPPLTPEQTQVLAQLAQHTGPFLLHGNTGSGTRGIVHHRCFAGAARPHRFAGLVALAARGR